LYAKQRNLLILRDKFLRFRFGIRELALENSKLCVLVV
jgi:hypothetical protein